MPSFKRQDSLERRIGRHAEPGDPAVISRTGVDRRPQVKAGRGGRRSRPRPPRRRPACRRRRPRGRSLSGSASWTRRIGSIGARSRIRVEANPSRSPPSAVARITAIDRAIRSDRRRKSPSGPVWRGPIRMRPARAAPPPRISQPEQIHHRPGHRLAHLVDDRPAEDHPRRHRHPAPASPQQRPTRPGGPRPRASTNDSPASSSPSPVPGYATDLRSADCLAGHPATVTDRGHPYGRPAGRSAGTTNSPRSIGPGPGTRNVLIGRTSRAPESRKRMKDTLYSTPGARPLKV